MTPKQQQSFCSLDDEALGLLKMAMSELHLSARAYDRILKVARTIADLEGGDSINATHVGEAVQYRTLDRNLWA
jgi:magnesium chelatase family protein